MTVSYKKLWKILIDKDMKKKDLAMAMELRSLRRRQSRHIAERRIKIER